MNLGWNSMLCDLIYCFILFNLIIQFIFFYFRFYFYFVSKFSFSFASFLRGIDISSIPQLQLVKLSIIKFLQPPTSLFLVLSNSSKKLKMISKPKLKNKTMLALVKNSFNLRFKNCTQYTTIRIIKHHPSLKITQASTSLSLSTLKHLAYHKPLILTPGWFYEQHS